MGSATTSKKVPVANMGELKAGNSLISVKRLETFGGGRTIEVTDNGKISGEVSSCKSLIWQQIIYTAIYVATATIACISLVVMLV